MARKPSKVQVKKEEDAAKSEERALVPGGEQTLAPLVSLRDEIDRVFEDFYSRVSLSPWRRWPVEIEPFRRIGTVFGGGMPVVDLADREKEWELTAELPGMEEKDIDVSLSDDVLTIEGRKEEKREEEGKEYRMAERRYGSFRRTLRLPEGVDSDKTSANLDKGVLTVTLPKTAEARKPRRKVDVKST